MQAQIQALLAGGAGGAGGQVGREEGRGGAEVTKPQIFDGTLAKVGGFITAYKLYIRMRLRGESVKRHVKNIDDGLQFLFSFSFYLLVFFISHLFSIFRTRVRV